MPRSDRCIRTDPARTANLEWSTLGDPKMAVSVGDPSREQRRRIAASALDGKLLNAPPPGATTASRSAIDEYGAFPRYQADSESPLWVRRRTIVGHTSSAKGRCYPFRRARTEWPLLREPNHWHHREGWLQTATAKAASRRTIGHSWPGKIHAKPVADGSWALGQAKVDTAPHYAHAPPRKSVGNALLAASPPQDS